jgi:hypothetical protein
MSASKAAAATPPVPAQKTNITWCVCLASGLAGLAFILCLVRFFEARKHDARVNQANEAVAAHITTGKELLARHEWEQACALFERALATRQATNFGNAAELLDEAEHARANDIWTAAIAAFDKNELVQADQLLRQYLDDRFATKKDDARCLLDEMGLATSDVKARELLRQLSPATLLQFAQSRQLVQLDQLRHPSLRHPCEQALRRNLPAEFKRRATQENNPQARRDAERHARELEKHLEEEQRLAAEKLKQEILERRLRRVRSTPVFREFIEFLALIRKQDKEFRAESEKADVLVLDLLLRKPGTKASGQQQKVLMELLSLPDGKEVKRRFAAWQAGTKEKISVNRALYQERFRTYPNVEKGDWAVFDREVDRSLDSLLRDVQRPLDDNLTEGLRALLGE